WSPFLAAVFTAAFFLLLTVKLVTLALACGVLAIACMMVWMWGSDPPIHAPVEIGGGMRLPAYATGPSSHSWWAMVILILVAAALYLSWTFSYLFLWTVAPRGWPAPSSLPAATWPTLSGGLLLASGVALVAAGRML